MFPGLNEMKFFKKSLRFFSPTKQIPTESFLLNTGKLILFAISLTSVFNNFDKGKIVLANSF